MPTGRPRVPFAERFWCKVDIAYMNDGTRDYSRCWPWKPGRRRTGKTGLYGRLRLPGEASGEITAPRAALLLYMGVPDDLLVQANLEYDDCDAGHTVCDNPACCNPLHLTWQLPLDNIREFVRKFGAFKKGVKDRRSALGAPSLLRGEETVPILPP